MQTEQNSTRVMDWINYFCEIYKIPTQYNRWGKPFLHLRQVVNVEFGATGVVRVY